MPLQLPRGFDPDATEQIFYRLPNGALVHTGGSVKPELPQGAVELTEEQYLLELQALEDANDDHVRDMLRSEQEVQASDHAELIAAGVSDGAARRMTGHTDTDKAAAYVDERRVTVPAGG